jgi:branched-chain amino acid aminotransferase
MTHALINGRPVPVEQATVSVFDRSFLYGDGLFETLRVRHGRPFRWTQHIERLVDGARILGIKLPCTADELREQALSLIEMNAAADSMLRLHLSRGTGSRGYSPGNAEQPLLVMTSHPPPALLSPEQPAEWSVIVAPWRLPDGEPLVRWKTANKLFNVLARKAADDAGADEALILNSRGEVCEASGSNLFWIERDQLFTPPAEAGVLPGVTREVIMELARQTGRGVKELRCPLDRLQQADAVFLTQSSLGVVRVCRLEGRALGGRALVEEWHRAYQRVLETETQS